jgi:cytochrome c biogenesis protein CcdA
MLMLTFVKTVYPVQPVVVEFLFYEACNTCPEFQVYYDVYVHNQQVMASIGQSYGNRIYSDWIDYHSTRGVQKTHQYNMTVGSEYWNSIIVNYEVILRGGDQFVDETYLRQIIDYYLTPRHDIAVISIIPASNSVRRGEFLDINVTTKNEGTETESFNVTAYYNSTLVEKISVDGLESNTEKLLVFRWNTTDVSLGNYTLSVHADALVNETDLGDNVRYYENIEVRDPSAAPSTRHDVGVISVVPLQTVVDLGQKLNITVTVRNLGTETESFNVNTYCNDSLIETLTVSNLSPNETRQMVFVWDTSGNTLGEYRITAQAEPVSKEIYLLDNAYVYNGVEVKEAPLTTSLVALLALAFTFGFFETFSPCLIILLSFILSYTVGKTTKFKTSFLQVMVFAIGFLAAAMLLGAAFGLMFLSLEIIRVYLTLAVCIFAVVFGLNLLGVFKLPFETKPATKELAKKYSVSFIGIPVLGFVFYFLDPCIAPIFVSMVPILFSNALPLILLVFCIGATIPFIAIGLFAGSISKLARTTYRHRSIIRGISGLILISYAIYLIISVIPLQL